MGAQQVAHAEGVALGAFEVPTGASSVHLRQRSDPWEGRDGGNGIELVEEASRTADIGCWPSTGDQGGGKGRGIDHRSGVGMSGVVSGTKRIALAPRRC